MVFRASYRGIGELLNSAEVRAIMMLIMAEAMARAVVIAPTETGRYKSAFEIGMDQSKGDRPRAFLRNNMWYALSVEFGAGPVPRHRTLGKALMPGVL